MNIDKCQTTILSAPMTLLAESATAARATNTRSTVVFFMDSSSLSFSL